MYRNKELYQFFLEKTWALTEDWYKRLDKSDVSGVYASDNIAVINSVKQQNYEFHKHFCEVFIKDETIFFDELEQWIVEIAQDEEHINELIMELSSPVISLNREIALLPLVGDIDTTRAKIMLESTLQQCASLGVNELLLDLSGVVMIDTMVAQQLFQLIKALDLIGVKTTLSGVRPEIAQTSVQLGISFDKVTIKSTLSSAIKPIEL
jgi:rsbT co-antagonist protein RsbR